MAKEELQKNEGTGKGKGSSRGRGRSRSGSASANKRSSAGDRNGSVSASTLFDPNYLVPVGYPGAAADVVPRNFGVTLDNQIDVGLFKAHVMDKDGKYVSSVSSNKAGIYTPGVARVDIMPTVGPKSPASSDVLYNAINECARSMYSHIRMNNAGSKAYDPSDLMMYVYAVASAYSFLSYLRRLYGVCSMYSYYNNYMPQRVMNAMGIAYPKDLLNNMSQFRDLINTYARRLAIYPVPKRLPIIDRMSHMYDNIYVDSNEPRAQIYVLNPYGFYVYGGVTGGHLMTIYKMSDVLPSNLSSGGTLKALTTAADRILQPILDSQDLGEIKRDILKTFGEEGIYSPTMIESDYSVFPTFDPTFLLALRNATVTGECLGSVRVDEVGKIHQVLNVNPNTPVYNKVLIDVPGVTPEEINEAHVLVATSFTTTVDDTQFLNLPPEIITSITIYDRDSAKEFSPKGWFQTDGEKGVLLNTLLSIGQFQHFPKIYCWNPWANGSVFIPNADIGCFRVMDNDELIRISRMKMEGLFGLPYQFR